MSFMGINSLFIISSSLYKKIQELLPAGSLICLMMIILFVIVAKLNGKRVSPTGVTVSGLSLSAERPSVEEIRLREQPVFDDQIPIRFKDLSFIIKDKKGKLLDGREVEISAKSIRGEELLQGNLKASTNSEGIATFSGVSVVKGGSIIIIATCEGKQCASEAVCVPDTTGPVTKLQFLELPEQYLDGSLKVELVKIKASNSEGDGVYGKEIGLSVLTVGGQEEASVYEVYAKSNREGIAVFQDIPIEKPGKWRFRASCDDTAFLDSEEFEISDMKVATLRFLINPLSTSSKSILNEIKIIAKNSQEQPLSQKTINVSITGTQYDESILLGTCSIPTNACGISSFLDLSVKKTGRYQLRASAEGVICLSRRFDIYPPGFSLDGLEYNSPEYLEALDMLFYLKKGNSTVRRNGKEL